MENQVLNELAVLKTEMAEIKRYGLLSAKQVLSVNDASLLTGLSLSHLYKMCCFKQIPYWKSPGGKITVFDKDELITWMKHRRIKTNDELESEAANIVTGKRKGKG